MVTPYLSKLCYGHTILLNAPSNLIFTATRIVDQRTEAYKNMETSQRPTDFIAR
ncbi:unnamed protein product [Callosobruchus maculatus]|uniref:Uncharacterized protein n=1 Tax=Callosobruchus maculatus TaxID=64391 RepID=A0A653CP62_CALMS|nr:unnamed protein product [Callosobruchus maculatus]